MLPRYENQLFAERRFDPISVWRWRVCIYVVDVVVNRDQHHIARALAFRCTTYSTTVNWLSFADTRELLARSRPVATLEETLLNAAETETETNSVRQQKSLHSATLPDVELVLKYYATVIYTFIHWSRRISATQL